MEEKQVSTNPAVSAQGHTPSSPSNGTTTDPLKTANISSVRKQNSSENVPAALDTISSNVAEIDDQGKHEKIFFQVQVKNVNISENEKDNDSRSGLSSQALVQRRRRPKRRSTGLVHVDMEVKLKFYKIMNKDKLMLIYFK